MQQLQVFHSASPAMPNPISILLVLLASLPIADQENDLLQGENGEADAQIQVSEADDDQTSDLVVFENIDPSMTERKDDGELAGDDVYEGDGQVVIYAPDESTELWTAPSIVVAIVGTVLLLIVVALTARTTRIAARANKQAAHSSEQQLRPWIILDPATGFGIKWNERGMFFEILIDCINRGKTPAVDVVAKCHFEEDANFRSDEFEQFCTEHPDTGGGFGCLAMYHDDSKNISVPIELSRKAIDRRKWNWDDNDSQPFFMHASVYISVIYKSIYDDVAMYQTAHVFEIESFQGTKTGYSSILLVDRDVLAKNVRFEQAGSSTIIT